MKKKTREISKPLIKYLENFVVKVCILHLRGGLEGVCVCVCVSRPDSWGYLHAHAVSHAVTQASCWALITSDKAWLAFYL